MYTGIHLHLNTLSYIMLYYDKGLYNVYQTKKRERYALSGLYVQENLPNDTPSDNVSNISKQEILVTIFSLK